MTKKQWLGCLLAVVLTAPHHATFAQDVDAPNCGGSVTNIYFGNGVGVTRAKARLSRNLIKIAYASTFEQQYPDDRFAWLLSYNPTRGKIADVVEVFAQQSSQIFDPSLTSGQIIALASSSQRDLASLQQRISEIESDTSFLGLFRRYSMLNAARAAASSLQIYIEGLNSLALLADTNESHRQLYRNNLLAGQRVVIIAHSQGNIFANDIVESLRSVDSNWQYSIGVVGVATPDSRTLSRSDYVTADDDRVIDALRSVNARLGRAAVLPSNLDNDPGVFDDPRDFTNHFFFESYFREGLASRSAPGIGIDDQMQKQLFELIYPNAELGDGAIRASLEWGNQPDVDLHIYEPDGSHVYYQELQGSTGILDRDDTNGQGPENYFVSCDAVVEGTYRFGVNYYAGDGIENARVQVTTSDGTQQTVSEVLTQAKGDNGDNSPLILISVTVDRDDEGVLKFAIEE